MIFYTLEKMGIPYVVVKYRLTCPSFDEEVSYRYQIMVDYDTRLSRLGFKEEREIERYQGVYMYRNLTHREVSIFRGFGYAPAFINENGAAWEFGGRLKRRRMVRVE